MKRWKGVTNKNGGEREGRQELAKAVDGVWEPMVMTFFVTFWLLTKPSSWIKKISISTLYNKIKRPLLEK